MIRSNASGPKRYAEFASRWTKRKRIRKSPEMLIMSFLPIEEVKMFAIFIYVCVTLSKRRQR